VKLRLLLLLACCLMLTSTLAMRASQDPESQSRVPGFPAHRVLDCDGEPCDAVARGALAFFDRRLHGLEGNGRACADCHLLTDNFQLSPAGAEARFQLLQRRRQRNPNADDPLFRPIDADDFRTNGESASDFSNLRANGLVRISFPLPPNIWLVDPATNQPSATERIADVWRMVPTVNDVRLTGPDDTSPWFRGPNDMGGYQLDGRVATLQEQALGALQNHAQALGVVPARLLDDLASFQRVLFTNSRVRALSNAIRIGTTPLPDPDPPLNELEAQGKVVFVRACAQCHGGPAQSNGHLPQIRFHSVASQCPRPIDTRPLEVVTPARFAFAACPPRLARNARTYEIALSVPTPGPTGILPAGTRVRRTSSDPGRAFLTGFVGGPPPLDDWDKFDLPALRGIKNTAPYFHNNSADTLEDVVDHYIELFKLIRVNAPRGLPPPPVASTDGINFDRQPSLEERAALLAYLRKL
jgi:cytochrome c peroxidase